MEAAEVTEAAFWSGRMSRVITPPRLEEAGADLQRLLPDEGTVVFASSGSAGPPKWISLRREALLVSAEAVNRHLEVMSGDRWMLALPLFLVGGCGVAARAYAGGCALRRLAGRWNAMRFVEELDESDATLTSLVPTQVLDLVACKLRPPEALRAVVVGGARLDDLAGQAARDLGWPVLQSYGLTEAASQVATGRVQNLASEFRSAPLPFLPIWEHRVGNAGCLELRGEALFDAYLRVEDNRLVVEQPFDGEGWFATGDVVELSPEGVTAVGRADRQVKVLGEAVDVQFMEEELRGQLLPESGVHILTIEDARRGWRLIPVIEQGGPEAEDVIGLFNQRLPGFARLEPPRYVGALPRTPLGKIDVAALREEFGLPER